MQTKLQSIYVIYLLTISGYGQVRQRLPNIRGGGGEGIKLWRFEGVKADVFLSSELLPPKILGGYIPLGPLPHHTAPTVDAYGYGSVSSFS